MHVYTYSATIFSYLIPCKCTSSYDAMVFPLKQKINHTSHNNSQYKFMFFYCCSIPVGYLGSLILDLLLFKHTFFTSRSSSLFSCLYFQHSFLNSQSLPYPSSSDYLPFVCNEVLLFYSNISS